jgi:predicted RNA-binding Zn-ribbon protein involved in translation (DUF1610 family)
MSGLAAYCPQCGVAWYQVLPHSLAEAADLLRPPVECGGCRMSLPAVAFYCPRCGTEVAHFTGEPPDEIWDYVRPPPGYGSPD